ARPPRRRCWPAPAWLHPASSVPQPAGPSKTRRRLREGSYLSCLRSPAQPRGVDAPVDIALREGLHQRLMALLSDQRVIQVGVMKILLRCQPAERFVGNISAIELHLGQRRQRGEVCEPGTATGAAIEV